MPNHFVGLRLNPDLPQEKAILTWLERLPAGQQSAEIKHQLYRAIRALPKEAAAPEGNPAPPATQEQRRKAWLAPVQPDMKQAAGLLGLLSAGEFKLLTAVAWHPYLSAADTAQWTGYSESFVRASLSFLEHGGALRAHSRVVAPLPRATYFTLTEFGVMALAVSQQQPLNATKRSLNFGPNQPGYFDHTVEANHFFLALHAQRDAGQLERWEAEAASRVTFPYPGRRRQGILRPDGYGEWVAEEWRYPFYLEWDRHDGNPRKLTDKLRLYLDYYAYLLQTPEPTVVLPRLLFVANDANRARLVWRYLAPLIHLMPYRPFTLRVTSRQQVWKDGPLAQIWQASVNGALVGPWEEESLSTTHPLEAGASLTAF